MASLYITHGGGPLPLYKHEEYKQYHEHFQELRKRYPNPKGIVVFSGEWEDNDWTMIDNDNPGLLYDYDNFP